MTIFSNNYVFPAFQLLLFAFLLLAVWPNFNTIKLESF